MWLIFKVGVNGACRGVGEPSPTVALARLVDRLAASVSTRV